MEILIALLHHRVSAPILRIAILISVSQGSRVSTVSIIAGSR
jgi:hypothetical protein